MQIISHLELNHKHVIDMKIAQRYNEKIIISVAKENNLPLSNSSNLSITLVLLGKSPTQPTLAPTSTSKNHRCIMLLTPFCYSYNINVSLHHSRIKSLIYHFNILQCTIYSR